MIISSRQIYTIQLTATRTSGEYYWGIGRGSGTKLFTVYGLSAYMTNIGSSSSAAITLGVSDVIFNPSIALVTGNSTGLKSTSGITFPIAASGVIFQIQQTAATDSSGVGTVYLDLDISY